MNRPSLFLGDLVIFYLSLVAVLITRYGIGDQFFRNLDLHFPPFIILSFLWLLVFYIANLYEIRLAKNNTVFFSNFIYAILISAGLAVLFFYLIPLFGITPKTNLFLFLAAYSFLDFTWRLAFNYIISRSGGHNNTLIIGNTEQSQELYDFLLNNPQLGYRALGIIDVTDNTAVEILSDLIKKKNTKTLVLSPSVYKIPRIINIFYDFIKSGTEFYSISAFYESVTYKIPLGEIDQIWFLENLSEGRKRGYEILKRIFDIIFACIIGVISIICYPFIMLAIKLDSRGPIFFKQRRVGVAGKTFVLVKFRNMVANSPDGSAEGSTGPVWASAQDPRVTRVGKVLRKTRIDELPQIWKVLRGEMSFVGPRPERPEFHDKLKQEIPFYEERYLIKPGLTGWAQVMYKIDFKGGMTIKDTFEKLQYDLYYIKNRSIILDVAIILKTIGKLLLQAGK